MAWFHLVQLVSDSLHRICEVRDSESTKALGVGVIMRNIKKYGKCPHQITLHALTLTSIFEISFTHFSPILTCS